MKVLVIMTLDYPDPILQNELPYLAKAFDKVYVLPEFCSEDTEFGNVEVISLFEPLTLKTRWRLLLTNIFRLIGLFVYTLQFSDRLKYIRYYKSFVGHYLNEAKKVDPLKKFIQVNGLGDAIFYDYWLVDATISLATLKRRRLIKRTFARVHGFDLYDERQYEGCVAFREYRVKNLDAVFAISAHGYEYLRSKLPSHLNEKVRLSYLGVNDPGYIPLDRQTAGSSYVIASCASLISLKRITLLAEVLQTTKLQIHWVHFGDGPLREQVEEAIRQLPGNVTVDLKGKSSNEEVLAFYKNFKIDLFVSLSQSEGLPVSMMEAISFGIPVFACSLNGIPELVNERTGKVIAVHADKKQILFDLEDTLLNVKFDRAAIYDFFVKNFNGAHNYNNFITHIHQVFKIPLTTPVYKECTQCVLSTADDPYISFNAMGLCHYCLQYSIEEARLRNEGKPGTTALQELVSTIKRAGEKEKYDCIIGVSGGVDSTYLAWMAKSFGLRPLAVHFDNGWNSELAVMNIENIVSRLGLDLHTVVVDWDEFRDLQLAFLKASVIDIELVTDHAMLATLYKLALQKNIKYILSGHNQVTEAVLPKNWYHDKRDHIHLNAIHELFGTIPVKKFPRLNSWLKFRVEFKRLKTVHFLDYIPYNSGEVKKFLMQELGWRDYGGKHYESVFTRFYQGYILPTKFGVDKRKAHLSNLICSGQISKEEAKAVLATPPYSRDLQQQDQAFVIKKLKLSEEEFQSIMQLPVKDHADYPIDMSIYERFFILKLAAPFWRVFKTVRNAF
jgi:N-acetyl sugar amidotransferase